MFKIFEIHVVLILLVYKCCVLLCCEESTFNNTRITIVGVRGIDFVSGCLEPVGALEKGSYIQIVNESVPVLNRGAIKNLPNLVDLILENNGILDIAPGAFYNLSKLYLMRLRNNNLQIIREGVFNALPVSELNLVNNSISIIEQKAFDRMPKLSIVFLDYNRISHWNINWFTYSPQINTLSFKNNLITHLPSRSFGNIKGFHNVNGRNVSTNIYLSENKISYIDPRSLEGLDVLGWFFLNGNDIYQIPESLLDPLTHIDWLKLSFNNLTCVPDKIFEKIPTVSHYLDGNPLTEECKIKLKKYS